MVPPVHSLRLWKLNERTGYWDYQRSVTEETADEWRRRFQIDDPRATFVVSRNKPVPPALRKMRKNPLEPWQESQNRLISLRDGDRDPTVEEVVEALRPLGITWEFLVRHEAGQMMANLDVRDADKNAILKASSAPGSVPPSYSAHKILLAIRERREAKRRKSDERRELQKKLEAVSPEEARHLAYLRGREKSLVEVARANEALFKSKQIPRWSAEVHRRAANDAMRERIAEEDRLARKTPMKNPIPNPVREPKRVISYYNGTAYDMSYVPDPKMRHNLAAMRIHDNGAKEGLVMEGDQVFRIKQGSKTSFRLSGAEKDEAMATIAAAPLVVKPTIAKNPLAPFGKEKTAEELLSRAAWEREQAAEYSGHSPIGAAHERTALAYERLAEERKGLQEHPISAEEHARLRAMHGEHERARESLDPKRFKRGGGYTPEEMSALPPSPTNEQRSQMEIYRFLHDPPTSLFGYVDEEKRTLGTFTGDKLGDVVLGRPFRDNFGGTRIPIHLKGINGKTYSGTYFPSSGTYARLKLVKEKEARKRNPLGVDDDTPVIISGMRDALHVTAWADAEEEAGRTYPGTELTEIAPMPTEAANEAALLLANRIVEKNKASLLALYDRASTADGLDKDEAREDRERLREFGWYLAMSALGHGVAWEDDHASFDYDDSVSTEFYYGDPREYGGERPRKKGHYRENPVRMVPVIAPKGLKKK